MPRVGFEPTIPDIWADEDILCHRPHGPCDRQPIFARKPLNFDNECLVKCGRGGPNKVGLFEKQHGSVTTTEHVLICIRTKNF
jgi:hypothetical protein